MGREIAAGLLGRAEAAEQFNSCPHAWGDHGSLARYSTGGVRDRLKGMPLAIQADDVRAAAVRIRPLARKKPVMTCAGFDAEAGVRVFFKCENLQRGGACKIRGAANLVLSLSRESLARGVVAYSSGNHAQATAIAAKYVGVPSTIVMPEDAPRSKMEATRAHGARIVTYNRFKDSREAIAQSILKETGA